MSSPYRTSAVVTPSSGLSLEGFEELQKQFPAKIYEPVMVAGEVLVIANGDGLVDWGGEYAS